MRFRSTLAVPVTGLSSMDVAVAETTTFTLVATNPGGVVQRTAAVHVQPRRSPTSEEEKTP